MIYLFKGEVRTYHFDPPSARGADLELHVQADILQRLQIGFPEVQVAAVPNGTHIASRAGRMKAKAEGLKAGFPDLILLAAEPMTPPDAIWKTPDLIGPRSAFIEVKAKEDTSQDQHDLLTWMVAAGFRCGVFRHQDTLAAKLKEWGFPHRERN